MDKNIHQLLIRSLDSELTDQEKRQLNIALADSEELRKEREKLLNMRDIIKNQDYQFKDNFENRVMNKIRNPKENNIVELDFISNLTFAFKRVAVSGIAAICILLLTVYISEGSLSLDSLMGINSLSIDDLTLYLSYNF